MIFKVQKFAMSLFCLIAACESNNHYLYLYKRFRNIQMDQCPLALDKVTSNNACAHMCHNQGNCNAFSFSKHDSLCRRCISGEGNTSLTFIDRVDTQFRRRHFSMSNFVLKENGVVFNISHSASTSGHLIYLRGSFDKKDGFTISLYNDTTDGIGLYRFATNDTTQTVQLSNRLGTNWQMQQEVPSPFVMDQTFELLLLLKSKSVISYVNQIHFNSYIYKKYSCRYVRRVIIDGYIFIEEFSL